MKLSFILLLLTSSLFAKEKLITKVYFEGNDHTSSEFIKKIMYISEGDVIDEAEIDELIIASEKRIRNTYFFYSVTLLKIPLSDDRVKIKVMVTEGFLYRFGGSADGIFLAKENTFGNGEFLFSNIGITTQTIGISRPYLFNTDLSVGVKYVHQKDNYYYNNDAWTRNIHQPNLFLSYSLSPNISVFWNATYNLMSRDTTDIISNVDKDRLFKKSGFDSHLSFYYKDLDTYFAPRAGTYISSTIGGLNTRKKFTISLKRYFKYNSKLYSAHVIKYGIAEKTTSVERWVGWSGLNGLMGKGLVTSGREAYLLQNNLNYEIMPVSLFSSTWEAKLFYNYGETFKNYNNKLLNFENVYGFGTRIIFSYPILVVAEMDIAFNKNGYNLVWGITSGF
jgi:outer membrane protein assembly factor BamA